MAIMVIFIHRSWKLPVSTINSIVYFNNKTSHQFWWLYRCKFWDCYFKSFDIWEISLYNIHIWKEDGYEERDNQDIEVDYINIIREFNYTQTHK